MSHNCFKQSDDTAHKVHLNRSAQCIWMKVKYSSILGVETALVGDLWWSSLFMLLDRFKWV